MDGRINLYWDIRNTPTRAEMLAFVAQSRTALHRLRSVLWRCPLLIYFPVRWAFRSCGRGDTACARASRADRCCPWHLAALDAQRVDERVPSAVSVAQPSTAAYVRQAWKVASEIQRGGERRLPAVPEIHSDLSRVAGADVVLLFIESYGAVSWDRPAFSRALAPGRAELTSAIADTGRAVVTAYVQSPTFGGKSWLAHISLLSGVDVLDEDTNAALMSEKQHTLVTEFGSRGYRTIAIMPGLQREWPEGSFYGFNEIYGADRLRIAGPNSGGGTSPINSQSHAWTNCSSLRRSTRRCSCSCHRSAATRRFCPRLPYQPDWKRVLTPKPYDEVILERAWSERPDWTDLGPGYVKAMQYVYTTLTGYLRLRPDRDFVMIIVGDHQPPAAVSGEGATWNVPIHVVTSRRAVLDQLVEHGFRDGLAPQRPVVTSMAGLMPMLLNAFGNSP
jgi:hypothetical protein